MQQIERYGVIALVFLLVTIVAVSFWGDSKSPGFWSRLTGKAKKEEVAKVEPPVVTSEQAINGGAPLGAAPAPENALVLGTTPAPEAQPLAGNTTPPATFPQDPALANAQLPGGAPQNGTMNGQPLGLGQPAPGVTPPAPVEPAPAATNEYTVQKGDSLALIARRTLGSEQRWSEIQTLNPGVTPKSLKIGMKLKLPDGATAVAQPKASEAAPKTASKPSTKSAPKVATKVDAEPKKSPAKGGARYTIQRGDTLNAIAEKKLGSKSRVKDILALNPGLDPRKLVVGKTITLPGGASSEKTPLVATAAANSTRPVASRVR